MEAGKLGMSLRGPRELVAVWIRAVGMRAWELVRLWMYFEGRAETNQIRDEREKNQRWFQDLGP